MSELEPIDIEVKNQMALPFDDIDIGAEPPEKEQVQKVEQKNDEGIDTLRRQLAQKQAEANEARRLKEHAERLLHERGQEVRTFQTQASTNQHTAFVNAIASFERDAEMLERDYAATLENGDYTKAAKIQRQMSQVESRLTQLAQGKEALEERITVQRQEMERPRQPEIQQMPRDPVEERISSLTPASQAWIRAHPEVISDPKLNARMTAAHWEALADDVVPESPEYFARIESKVYDNKNPQQNSRETQRSNRPQAMAAPVSRSSTPSFKSNGSINITLSPAEREAARDMDMTDEDYAESIAYYVNKGQLKR